MQKHNASWFGSAVKHCADCGRGSTKADRATCKDCGSSRFVMVEVTPEMLAWHGRVCIRVVSADGLPKPDAIVVVSNGSTHHPHIPATPDGPDSLKRATLVRPGTSPQWDEDLIFPAGLVPPWPVADNGEAVSSNDEREFAMHLKHLAMGKKWSGNNEGEWLGKAVIKLSDIVASPSGLTLSLPVLKNSTATGAVLHLKAFASAGTFQQFKDDTTRFATAAPSFPPPPPPPGPGGGHVRPEAWPVWRCYFRKKDEQELKSTAAHATGAAVSPGVREGSADFVLIQKAATPRREHSVRWLHSNAILGAELEEVGGDQVGNRRVRVSLFILTAPTAADPERGNSCHQILAFGGFQDEAYVPVYDRDTQTQMAQACCDALRRVGRSCSPLNDRCISQRTEAVPQLLVLINPMSGHKMGLRVWAQVQTLLEQAEVAYRHVQTTHAGHAREVVKDLGVLQAPEKWSGVLVIGGDGTVLEVLNAFLEASAGGSGGSCDSEGGQTVGFPTADIGSSNGEAGVGRALSVAVGTIPAGSECAFAKMTTFVDVYSAAWVLLKGHRCSAIDVLQLSQGARVTHALCGVGWGLGGKLAEESEELRKAFGPARYLVSGIKSFVELRGCPASVRLLVPRHPDPLPSSAKVCYFGKHCDVCDSSLPFAPAPSPLPQESTADAEWLEIHGEFVLVCILKSAKLVAPCVHTADGLVDVVLLLKHPDAGHMKIALNAFDYYLAANCAAQGQAREGSAPSGGCDGGGEDCSGGGEGDAGKDCDGDGRKFVTRKALAVEVRPENPKDKFNIDGEVFEGLPLTVQVLPRVFPCMIASTPGAAPPAEWPQQAATVLSANRSELLAGVAERFLKEAQPVVKGALEELKRKGQRASQDAEPVLDAAADALASTHSFVKGLFR